MLAPADEKAPNATDELSTRKWEIVERSPRAWMFQVQTIDLNRSPNVVARVILAKFNADDAMRSQIDEILGDLHIDEHNPDFRSRVWAMNGIEALHSAGISRHDMSRSDVEKLAFELVCHWCSTQLADRADLYFFLLSRRTMLC
jgi:hypothetical protein